MSAGYSEAEGMGVEEDGSIEAGAQPASKTITTSIVNTNFFMLTSVIS